MDERIEIIYVLSIIILLFVIDYLKYKVRNYKYESEQLEDENYKLRCEQDNNTEVEPEFVEKYINFQKERSNGIQ